MRIISFIEDRQIIRDILTHPRLWLVRSRPPPKIHHAVTLFDHAVSDSPAHASHSQTDTYADPEYFWDDYIPS